MSLSELKILKCTAKELADATSAEVEQWRTDCRCVDGVVLQTALFHFPRYPEYILQHIQDLPSSEPNRSLKSALLLYAGYLIQMHNMNSRKVQKEGIETSVNRATQLNQE